MKLYLYITNPEDYFDKEFKRFAAYINNQNMPDSWIFAGEIEFEPKFNEINLRKIAIDNLDQEIKRVNAESQIHINELETRKQNLLAIEHKLEVTE